MSAETILCVRNGCDVTFVRASVGRPRKFCSTACRRAHSRAEIRAVQANPTYRTIHASLTNGDDVAVVRTADYARLLTATARAFETLQQLRKNMDPLSAPHAQGYRDACEDMRTCLREVRVAIRDLNLGTEVGNARK